MRWRMETAWDARWSRRWAVSAAALCLLLEAACAGPKKTQAAGTPVTAAEAAVKDVPSVVTAIGSVEAYSTVAVKALVAGQLTEVHFREGQDVRKGDLLFTIDPRPYQASLDQAKARLERDKAQLSSAEAQAFRYADLVKKDFVTQQQNDDAISNAAALKATVKADQADVADAALNLSYCFIRAPMDGRLGNLLVNEGNLVKANDTQVLVNLNRITPVYVSFSVPEEKLGEIRRLAASAPLPVSAILPAEPGSHFGGTLSFFNNAVDSNTGTILLKATFPNQDRGLWPGQFVNVTLVLSTMKDAVVIPAEAVQQGQGGAFVYVVRPDMTAELRKVQAGQVLDGQAVIKAGLKGGEEVVTDGQLRLFDGARVEITGGLQQAGSAGGVHQTSAG